MSSHTCLHYGSEKELLDIVVYFFEQGFRANELCAWIVPHSLGVEGAKAALGERIEGLNMYMEKGQFELLNHKDVYFGAGMFNPDNAIKILDLKKRDALKRGFSGIRISGDASWLQEKDWYKLIAYEKASDKFLAEKNIPALCTYPDEKIDPGMMASLALCHTHIIRKKDGKVDIIAITR